MLCPFYVKVGTECFYIYPDISSDITWGGWGSQSNIILLVQHVALTIIVLHYGNSIFV